MTASSKQVEHASSGSANGLLNETNECNRPMLWEEGRCKLHLAMQSPDQIKTKHVSTKATLNCSFDFALPGAVWFHETETCARNTSTPVIHPTWVRGSDQAMQAATTAAAVLDSAVTLRSNSVTEPPPPAMCYCGLRLHGQPRERLGQVRGSGEISAIPLHSRL